MAHRLVYESSTSVKLKIYERSDIPIKGEWKLIDCIVDHDKTYSVVSNGSEQRTYSVREWLSDTECRATLQKVKK